MPKIPDSSVGIQMERSVSTRIFGITSGGGPLITYFGLIIPAEIRHSIFDTGLFALIREFGKGIQNGNSHSYWLAWFNCRVVKPRGGPGVPVSPPPLCKSFLSKQPTTGGKTT